MKNSFNAWQLASKDISEEMADLDRSEVVYKVTSKYLFTKESRYLNRQLNLRGINMINNTNGKRKRP